MKTRKGQDTPMLFSILLGASAYCAVLPAALFCLNLRRFRQPPPADDMASVSVLIPARNEEANIGEALRSVLASRAVALQVVVLDDDSTDKTAALVEQYATEDARVSLLRGHTLPHGWNGKQYACWTLAQQASKPLLAFLDADVRVDPDLLARMVAFQRLSGSALVTGFPRLITETWLEQLLLPLIHFVLLAYLPMGWMRKLRGGTRPSFAAGCGQFLLVEHDAYFATGGHSSIRETMHDGLLLPKLFRNKRYRTDLADITELASVRMYDSAAKVWQGLAKNATEGMATPGKIVPLSAILVLGQILPTALAIAWISSPSLRANAARRAAQGSTLARQTPLLLVAAVVGSFAPRLLAVRRFKQPISSALLQPVGIAVLLGVQWYAFARKLFGKPIGWRQRTYVSSTGAELGS